MRYTDVLRMMRKHANIMEDHPVLTGGLASTAVMAPIGALIAGKGRRLKGALAAGIPAFALGAAGGKMWDDTNNARRIAEYDKFQADNKLRHAEAREYDLKAAAMNEKLDLDNLKTKLYNIRFSDKEHDWLHDILYGKNQILNKLDAIRALQQNIEEELGE